MASQVLFWLALIFIILLFLVCRKKGFYSLLSLGLTIIILLKIFVPLLIKGYNPVLITIAVALPILVLIIYLTEGFNVTSHLTIGTIIINFALISLLTWLAVSWAGLSGMVSEEAVYAAGTTINMQGLLIAGIILGTLGVLTEMVVTQVAAVAELIKSDAQLERKQIFKQAYNIGTAHLGSMINTLFLIYAGVSLPVLIMISGSGYTWKEILQFELIVSEIIRTLTSTIGLIISMPIATAIAVWWLKKPVAEMKTK